MKVYVLQSKGGEHPAYELEGVFSTAEKAREAVEILDLDCAITELEVDEFKIQRWDGGFGTKRIEVRKL